MELTDLEAELECDLVVACACSRSRILPSSHHGILPCNMMTCVLLRLGGQGVEENEISYFFSWSSSRFLNSTLEAPTLGLCSLSWQLGLLS